MNTRILAVAAALCALAAVTGVTVARSADAPDLPVTHEHWDIADVLSADPSGTTGQSVYVNPPSPICGPVTGGSTDCEGNAPHNETSIAVNPTDTSNMVGGANDYQLNPNSGGGLVETAFTRAHVSFDGGKSWSMYPIDYNGYTFTGDPAFAFDASGRVYAATLGFTVSQGLSPTYVVPDVVVSTSNDGGKTWSSPDRVVSGSGSANSVGTFNDKEEIAAWGNGNAIVTWTNFKDGIGGSYLGSPIMDSVTHDGGRTWSAPQEISGGAPFCVGFGGSTQCDEDQGSTPVVAADGSIYVAFISSRDNGPDFRDQYVAVEVDPVSGARVGGPYRVAALMDGVSDYPVNVDGRPTYQDSQFRTWSLGNVAADPTNAKHLAVVWSDMRNSQLPAPTDPYTAKTNSDVGVSQSYDGGKTWSAATVIPAFGDQFMPWSTYDASGRLRIGYFDRSYDAANHKYGYTLATEKKPGSLSFSTAQLTTTLSDPTQGTRWFSGRTPNPSFPHPTTFLGDYSGIAANPAGGIAALWTDMRLSTCFSTRCGTTEDAWYGSGK